MLAIVVAHSTLQSCKIMYHKKWEFFANENRKKIFAFSHVLAFGIWSKTNSF